MNSTDVSASHQVQFIDHRALDWATVRRTRCLFYQRFRYDYPGPIRNLKQRLVIVPADHFGAQQVRDHLLTVTPAPITTHQAVDHFGNRVLELEVAQADHAVSFEVLMIVENDREATPPPPFSAEDIRDLLEPTPLTLPDEALEAASRELADHATSAHDLAQRVSEWVWATMRYRSGVTTVQTTAAEAFRLREGLCQDYAHIMLALCRLANLPARYVSGHLLGDEGSHAWVEVLLPTETGLRAVAFDPTNNRRPHLGYITVAVGRDYRDVTPTSGSYTAPYGGQLTCIKRAGLTLVEYLNGQTVRS